jgi:hypothetical protein
MSGADSHIPRIAWLKGGTADSQFRIQRSDAANLGCPEARIVEFPSNTRSIYGFVLGCLRVPSEPWWTDQSRTTEFKGGIVIICFRFGIGGFG